MIREVLLRIGEINGCGPGNLLFRLPGATKPYDKKAVSKALYRALAKAGVDESQRSARNLTFHSWRYLFNTYLRAANI